MKQIDVAKALVEQTPLELDEALSLGVCGATDDCEDARRALSSYAVRLVLRAFDIAKAGDVP